MPPPEVLAKNSASTENGTADDCSDDEFESTVAGKISSFNSNYDETSIAKLPGTSLLKSVHNRNLHSSNHTLQSDQTYDFDKKNDPYDSLTEFGEDSARSYRSDMSSSPPEAVAAPIESSTGRVPAWKLRQQAQRKHSPPPPRKIIGSSSPPKPGGRSPPKPGRPPSKPNGFRRSPFQSLRKTNPDSGNNPSSNESRNPNDPNGDKTWLQRLRTKKETEEEKEKRIKNEKLIDKQVASRWGKDILEEDSDEYDKEKENNDEKNKKEETIDEEGENDVTKNGETDGGENDGDDESEKAAKEYRDEDESDTVKKVKSLIEKSFGSALIATIKKDKEKNVPDASVFAKDVEDDGADADDESETKKPPNRGNRWAMMGSAAMTSMRNLQRGLIGDGEEKKADKDPTIAEEDEDDSENNEENGDKVAENLENRRNSMWKNRGAAAFTSVRNAWGGAASRRRSLEINSDGDDDDLDAKSVHSEPDRLDRGDDEDDSNNNNNNNNNNKILLSIGNFVRYQRAKFDPEVWADPEIQESLRNIEKLKTKIQESRIEHRSVTRRREKQVENSITQQKIFLARKLHRLTYGYKKDPFHPCIKDVYEKEIRIIVHDATSLFGDPDAEHEKDDIDDLLDSSRFEDDFPIEEDNEEATTKSGDGSIIDQFLGRKSIDDDKSIDTLDDDSIAQHGKPINRDSLIPLETRLLRAQHNEWMTEHQKEIVRPFQQNQVAHLIDLLPELRADHEKLKAISQQAVEAKLREMEESNTALKKAYEAHLEAQEKLLTIYRERYVPSVHEDESEANIDKPDDTNEVGDENGEKGDTLGTPPTTPTRQIRPNMWAKNFQQSVRGLFGPKKDEAEAEAEDKDKEKDTNDAGESSEAEGFSLSSPITGGSLGKGKFVLSFGSPAASAASSGIMANFTAPPLSKTNSIDDDAHTDAKDSTKLSLQESAADSAEAVWRPPKQVDKASLPESAAEKRSRRAAERAAARKANRPDSVTSGSGRNGVSASATSVSTSRSELLERARKARQESTDALKGHGIATPISPTPSARSGRSGRTSLRSSAGVSTSTATTSGSRRNGNSRKELSMKDLLEKAGDSRRKLQENDSRMERLTHKKELLKNSSPLNSPGEGIAKTSTSSGERRRRIVKELKHDDSLRLSSHHSLHERKPRQKLTRLTSRSKIGKTPCKDADDDLKDVDEFGD